MGCHKRRKKKKRPSKTTREWLRERYWKWPDLSAIEKQELLNKHKVKHKSKMRLLYRMQRLRRQEISWTFKQRKVPVIKLTKKEMDVALKFYRENRWKYANFGGWNKEFGKKLSTYMKAEFGDEQKWKFKMDKKRKNRNCLMTNSLLIWLCRRIRKTLNINGDKVVKKWINTQVWYFSVLSLAFFIH